MLGSGWFAFQDRANSRTVAALSLLASHDDVWLEFWSFLCLRQIGKLIFVRTDLEEEFF